ncbi:DUF4365 domain-containing protein [Streptacidiphilus sp. MAP12-20]|uniref:DUF4365 domain-containing protein n=1 Tax=Streptacidiphilus sp. MAP12-20 TaxID=3156299 RepID=UPI003513522C
MAKVLGTKRTERAGVNEFRSLMESAGHIVQEIDGGNDYGEDCYLSFTERGERTGDIVSVQVKSGLKYRRAVGYGIPCRGHVEDWSRSRIPVIGVVFDPEIGKLYWVNMTAYLLDEIARGRRPRSIPLQENSVLDRQTVSSVVGSIRRFIARDDGPRSSGPGGVRRVARAIRRYNNRHANDVEKMWESERPLPEAVAQVEFYDRHPNFLANAAKYLTMLVMGVSLAMTGPGLREAAQKNHQMGWMWLLCFYGTIAYLLRLGWKDSNRRRAATLRIGAYFLFFSGWYIAFGGSRFWPVNQTYESIFVDEMPTIAQVAVFQIGGSYVLREIARRRRLRALHGHEASE